jgi:hypothetical protein
VRQEGVEQAIGVGAILQGGIERSGEEGVVLDASPPPLFARKCKYGQPREGGKL